VHDLIVTALQERRINRANGLKPSVAKLRQTSPRAVRQYDVEAAAREFLGKLVQPVPLGIAALIAMIFSSRAASAMSASRTRRIGRRLATVWPARPTRRRTCDAMELSADASAGG